MQEHHYNPQGHHGHHGYGGGHHGGHGYEGYGFFEGNRTSPAICTNETLDDICNRIYIGSWGIQSPELIPCCLMALYLGITLSRATIKTKTNANVVYAITFLMVGCMMTFAMIGDTLLPLNVSDKSPLLILVFTCDVGLTSSIGYSFMIDGLVDAGILHQNKKSTYWILGGGMAAIFSGWIYTFITQWKYGFTIMYLGVVAITCGSWVVIQIALMVISKNCKGLKYFFLAAFTGGFGFCSLMNAKLNAWMCETFTCYFGSEFIWFFVTDTAIYFIYLFYKERHGLNQGQDPVMTLYQKLKNSF